MSATGFTILVFNSPKGFQENLFHFRAGKMGCLVCARDSSRQLLPPFILKPGFVIS